MTTNRDQWNSEQRWTTTGLSFTSNIHQPKDQSFWAAARRTLVIYDWLGHGRNRAKQCALTPEQQAQAACCSHCQQPDSQAHCMLDCTFPLYAPIRQRAKTRQASIARALLDQDIQFFIQQFCHASWTRSRHISRIWLGTWSTHTLRQLLGQPIDEPMTMEQRYQYIKIARKLTEVLLEAYHEMLNMNIRHVPAGRPSNEADLLPLYDHLPMDTHAEVPPPSLPPEPEVRVWELAALLEQYDDDDPGISLHQARLVDLRGPYK